MDASRVSENGEGHYILDAIIGDGVKSTQGGMGVVNLQSGFIADEIRDSQAGWQGRRSVFRSLSGVGQCRGQCTEDGNVFRWSAFRSQIVSILEMCFLITELVC